MTTGLSLKSVARFWAGVDRKGPTECWPFLGSHTVQWDGRPQEKRRVAWLVSKGRIPKGQMVLLECGSSLCGNPAHMFLGKHKERAANMLRHGRGTLGENSRTAKVTADDVRAIRQEYRSTSHGESNVLELAKRYGLGRGAVVSIVARRYWKHIE